MFANFIHPITGEKRQVKIGWSWTLFFFWGFYGIPFFVRKMISYGVGAIILPILSGTIFGVIMAIMFGSSLSEDELIGLFFLLYMFVYLIISILLLVKGNKMTAKYYLNQGFRIENDDEFVKKQVKIAWKFTDDVFVENNLKEEK